MQDAYDQTAPGKAICSAATQSAWFVNQAPETLYRPVPQFGAGKSGLIAIFAIIPIVVLQWFTSRAAIELVMPLVPDYLNHFGWTFGYVGHIIQAVVAFGLIMVLRPWFPSSFGLCKPRTSGYLWPALILGSLAGPLMLIVDYLPDLLAHHAPAGPYALGVSNVVPWLFMQGALVGPTEEIVFRGLFLGYLLCIYPRRIKLLGQKVSIAGIVIAVVFSLAHAGSFWETTLFAAIGQQIYVTALGIFYAWLYEKSGSLLAPALAHNAGDFIEWAACFALRGMWGHH